MLQTSTCS